MTLAVGSSDLDRDSRMSHCQNEEIDLLCHLNQAWFIDALQCIITVAVWISRRELKPLLYLQFCKFHHVNERPVCHDLIPFHLKHIGIL